VEEKLKRMREAIEDWGKLPLAASYQGELSRLDEEMDNWWTELERAFRAVEEAAVAKAIKKGE